MRSYTRFSVLRRYLPLLLLGVTVACSDMRSERRIGSFLAADDGSDGEPGGWSVDGAGDSAPYVAVDNTGATTIDFGPTGDTMITPGDGSGDNSAGSEPDNGYDGKKNDASEKNDNNSRPPTGSGGGLKNGGGSSSDDFNKRIDSYIGNNINTLPDGRKQRAHFTPKQQNLSFHPSDYPYQTPIDSPEGQKLAEGWAYKKAVERSFKPDDPRDPERRDLAEVAGNSLSEADQHYVDGKKDWGDALQHLGILALDMAVSLSPAGWGKDLYEATTGKSLFTQEKLDNFTRGMAILCVGMTIATTVSAPEALPVVAVATEIIRGKKAVEAAEDVAKAGKAAEKIVDSAKKIGAASAEEVKSFGHLIETTAKKAPEATNIIDFEKLRAALAVEEIQGAKVIGSAMKDDAMHRSASFMLDTAAKEGRVFALKGGDEVSRNLLQVEGALNNNKGIFEWIVGPEGLVHQRFIKNGRITGFPNQIPGQ